MTVVENQFVNSVNFEELGKHQIHLGKEKWNITDYETANYTNSVSEGRNYFYIAKSARTSFLGKITRFVVHILSYISPSSMKVSMKKYCSSVSEIKKLYLLETDRNINDYAKTLSTLKNGNPEVFILNFAKREFQGDRDINSLVNRFNFDIEKLISSLPVYFEKYSLIEDFFFKNDHRILTTIAQSREPRLIEELNKIKAKFLNQPYSIIKKYDAEARILGIPVEEGLINYCEKKGIDNFIDQYGKEALDVLPEDLRKRKIVEAFKARSFPHVGFLNRFRMRYSNDIDPALYRSTLISLLKKADLKEINESVHWNKSFDILKILDVEDPQVAQILVEKLIQEIEQGKTTFIQFKRFPEKIKQVLAGYKFTNDIIDSGKNQIYQKLIVHNQKLSEESKLRKANARTQLTTNSALRTVHLAKTTVKEYEEKESAIDKCKQKAKEKGFKIDASTNDLWVKKLGVYIETRERLLGMANELSKNHSRLIESCNKLVGNDSWDDSSKQLPAAVPSIDPEALRNLKYIHKEALRLISLERPDEAYKKLESAEEDVKVALEKYAEIMKMISDEENTLIQLEKDYERVWKIWESKVEEFDRMKKKSLLDLTNELNKMKVSSK